jgi:hypothetical protein
VLQAACAGFLSGALGFLNKESDMADEHGMAAEPQGFGDLPIQPTGSGVKELEIAYEQMKLAEDDGSDVDSSSRAEEYADSLTPTEGGIDAAASAAHPS